VTKIEDYREVAPRGAIDTIMRLAERVQGRRFLNLSGGRFGGGSAELLHTLVPILTDLGIEARWEITGGDPKFYATARALQAALQGEERVLTDEGLEHYVEMNRISARKLELDADLVLVHDVEPAMLVHERTETGRWVWHCHIDCSRAQRRAWSFMRPHLNRYDAAVFALPKFGRRLAIPQFTIYPSIDPRSDKNRELPVREITAVLAALRVRQDQPILLQVGPFNRRADPVGVVNAYRLVKRYHPVSVVLAGTAGDERENIEVLGELREAARDDERITVLELPPDAHLQINALQRAATIVLQKSVREGFGIGVSEAMWKGKPVIAGMAGGLGHQVLYDVTGYTVFSVEGAAFRLRHLLNSPELIARMGAAGREHVRRSYLITRQLTDYLALLIHMTR
jgi:trehalose synthase